MLNFVDEKKEGVVEEADKLEKRGRGVSPLATRENRFISKSYTYIYIH